MSIPPPNWFEKRPAVFRLGVLFTSSLRVAIRNFLADLAKMFEQGGDGKRRDVIGPGNDAN